MTEETDTTRDLALGVMQSRGYSWSRVGKGQRHVVHLQYKGRKISALIKVASRGTAMVRTDGDDADTSRISGFGDDVDHVLFAVGDPTASVRSVTAFLVPALEAELAFRDAHRAFRKSKPHSKPSVTWVISFRESGDSGSNGYASKWKRYAVGTGMSGGLPIEGEALPALTIAQAKEQLSASLGVPVESIKITIEA